MLGSMKKKAIQYVLRCFERNQRLAAFQLSKFLTHDTHNHNRLQMFLALKCLSLT